VAWDRDTLGYDLAAEPRPPRRWPWVLAALLVLAVIVAVVVAAVTGRFLPYQADREELTATPFVIRAQAGVPPLEEDRVRAGLVASHALLDESVGGDVGTSVEVRLTWSQGCQPHLGPTSIALGWADEDLLCLNASHPAWRQGVDGHVWFPAFVAAREHVHLWQQSLGCAAGDEEWHWLYQGMADHLAFVALERAGIVRPAQTAAFARELGGDDPGLGPLSEHEAAAEVTPATRGRFLLATRELATSATPQDFADFCASTGQGVDWHDAFGDAFRIEVDEVQARVAARVGG
jgi:hypothetical protein